MIIASRENINMKLLDYVGFIINYLRERSLGGSRGIIQVSLF